MVVENEQAMAQDGGADHPTGRCRQALLRASFDLRAAENPGRICTARATPSHIAVSYRIKGRA
jgi:hypothetical protein